MPALASLCRTARPTLRRLGLGLGPAAFPRQQLQQQRRDMAALAGVADVEIDSDGVFKYILVKLSRRDGPEHKDIVRGTKSAEYHNHIFEKLTSEMEKLELDCKCLGGGKIDHNSKQKKIRVFGLSTGFGKADHSISVEKLKTVYKDYEITWSDETK
ncbi:14 kDa phosphohistidine phosphatase [Leucoraja erinacea]|uniref:14 kDa phosphohistidine phosphatase n=1 Tax=Leucoraja erinaceus TaxID=7782 RepID=UPI002456DA39|nr:14 kDa phosphohistidine phosphatase [Leucoraja erinacea]